eukprot:1150199-Pelagomonas_calceolata.AAC.10
MVLWQLHEAHTKCFGHGIVISLPYRQARRSNSVWGRHVCCAAMLWWPWVNPEAANFTGERWECPSNSKVPKSRVPRRSARMCTISYTKSSASCEESQRTRCALAALQCAFVADNIRSSASLSGRRNPFPFPLRLRCCKL